MRNTFTENDDTVTCGVCGLQFRYNEQCMLEGVRFRTIKEFADWQKTRVAADVAAGETYEVEFATLSSIENHEATQVAAGAVSINNEMLRCEGVELPLADISDMGIHGRHALVFSVKGTYYELIPSEEFSIQQILQYYNCVKQK